MNAPRHTLDQLLVLDAIDRAGSFAGAARALRRETARLEALADALGEPVPASLTSAGGR